MKIISEILKIINLNVQYFIYNIFKAKNIITHSHRSSSSSTIGSGFACL